MLSCEDQINIFEPSVTAEKIEFPFEDRDSGKFSVIYQNETDESIPFSLILASKAGTLIENSKNLDMCEGINAIRSNKIVREWTVLNYNYPIIPNSAVNNKNDTPNLISYNLPKGTYIITLMDEIKCSKENYKVFDITSNE